MDNQQTYSPSEKRNISGFRFWMIWAIILALFWYGMHRYFEYRVAQLDKRLEMLNK